MKKLPLMLRPALVTVLGFGVVALLGEPYAAQAADATYYYYGLGTMWEYGSLVRMSPTPGYITLSGFVLRYAAIGPLLSSAQPVSGMVHQYENEECEPRHMRFGTDSSAAKLDILSIDLSGAGRATAPFLTTNDHRP